MLTILFQRSAVLFHPPFALQHPPGNFRYLITFLYSYRHSTRLPGVFDHRLNLARFEKRAAPAETAVTETI